MAFINVSVDFSYRGKVYAGLALAPGVGIDLAQDPWSERKLLTFPFCSVYPSGLFWDSVTARELEAEEPAQGYLVLEPDAV